MASGANPPQLQSQPPHSPDELKFAHRSLEKLVQDSQFFPFLDMNNRVQTIAESKLDYGSIIGKGGFCEVRCVGLRHCSSGDQRRGVPTNTVPPKYAMKYLSPTKTTSSKVFQRGVADLAMEACFLSLLRHDNIIGLHYVSEGSLEDNYNCLRHQIKGRGDDEIYLDANGNLQLRRRATLPSSYSHLFGYFLLLDPLHETLADRIEKTYIPQSLPHDPLINSTSNAVSTPSQFQLWDRIRHKNNLQSVAGNNILNAKFHLAQRLEVVSSIASALTYLHDNCRIIYRDVKPDNIGFYRRLHPHCTCGCQQEHGNRDRCSCFDEVTKLFDFGLAKELKPKYRKTHPAYPDLDTYKLTGCTGSRRYMAPEVCFSEPYNEKADVYSFGILLYQVASLVTPFDGYSMGEHERYVLREGHRPDVKSPQNSFMGKKSSTRMQHDQSTLSLNEGAEEVEKKNRLLALRTTRYWPKDLPRLMEECWDCDMRYRPSMKVVTSRLQRFIEDLIPERISSISGIGPGHWPKFNSHNAKGEVGHSKSFATRDISFMGSHHTFPHGGSHPISDPIFYDLPQQQHQQQHASSFFPLSRPGSFSGKRDRKNESGKMDIDTAVKNRTNNEK
jgi:serine/threonine protein kinase